jgi:hypothetical protein
MINAILGATLVAVALMGAFYLGAHCAFRAMRKALEKQREANQAMKTTQGDDHA